MSYQFKFVTEKFAESYEKSIELNRNRDFISTYSIREKLTQKTFAEFDCDVQKVMHLICESGALDQVVTLAANEYEHLVYIVASWLLGIAHCPVNPQEPLERVDSKVKALGGTSAVFHSPLTIPAALNEKRIESLPFAAAMTLIFTSGTTGFSKIVPQDEVSIMANVDCLIQRHSIGPETVLCTPLPVFHVNALHFSFLACLLTGAKFVLLENFVPSQVWQVIESEKVQILSVVPQIIRHMVKNHTNAKNSDLSALKYVVSAAAPLSAELATDFYARFNRKIIQGFGLSEAVNFSCLIPVDISEDDYKRFVLNARFPSIGTPLACNEVAVEDGEIILSGVNLMQGYRNEGHVKSVVNGKFKTGDLGYFETDASGQKYFFISGRKKDIVKKGGMTVSLREVDEIAGTFQKYPVDSIAVPFENIQTGEDFGLVLNSGDIANIEDLKNDLTEFLNAKLPPHMRPSIVIITERPLRTPSGKPLRWELQPLFQEFKTANLGAAVRFFDKRN